MLDYALNREDYTQAEKILNLVLNRKVQAYITTSVLHITGYWLSKAYGSIKAKKLLISFLADIFVIDIPHEIALVALNSQIDDIEDALQYYTAMHHKLDYFISRDKLLRKESIAVLPVFTPQQFLEIF